jgi:hypothetical protein
MSCDLEVTERRKKKTFSAILAVLEVHVRN